MLQVAREIRKSEEIILHVCIGEIKMYTLSVEFVCSVSFLVTT